MRHFKAAYGDGVLTGAGREMLMAQAPRTLTPLGSALHLFGAELRHWRKQRQYSQDRLGREVHVSGDLIAKIEKAERRPPEHVASRCDAVLDTGGALRRLWPLVERERRLRTGREPAQPSQEECFYADATDRPVLDWLLASPTDGRCGRSDDDAVVEATTRLQRLRDVDHVHGAGETYPNVANFLRRELPTLTDQAPRVAVGFLELAGYEAVDLGADGTAQRHYLRALEVCTASGDRLYGGYLIGVSLAHLALHCGEAEHAVRLATAALRGTERYATPAVRAAFRAVLARGHARLGDERSCVQALHCVEAELAHRDPANEPDWISYFSEADLADEKAHCFFDLGQHRLAEREAVSAIGLLTPSRVRRLAIDSALHASALVRTGDVDHACAVGRVAVDHAANTASFRSSHRIALMMAELFPYTDVPQVRDLAEYARSRLPPVPTLTLADRAR